MARSMGIESLSGPGKSHHGREWVSSLPGYRRIVTLVAPAAGSVPPPVLPLVSLHVVAEEVGMVSGRRAIVAPMRTKDDEFVHVVGVVPVAVNLTHEAFEAAPTLVKSSPATYVFIRYMLPTVSVPLVCAV